MEHSPTLGIRRLAHVTLWCGLISAFVCISAPRIFRAAGNFSELSPQLAGSDYQSTDVFLGERGGSKRLIQLLQSTPESHAVIIVVRRNDHLSELHGMLAAYFAWPRPVRMIDSEHLNDATLNGIGPAAALIFCGINAAFSQPPPQQIGNYMRVVPIRTVVSR